MAKKNEKKTASKTNTRNSRKTKGSGLVKIIRRSGAVINRSAAGPVISGQVGSGGAQVISMAPLYYDYRYSTPDKFYFPRDRAQANSIWRDIYRRDATIGICTDLYSELPWSRFDIEGIDDGAIRKIYEDMFNTLNLVPKLASYAKDFIITGELILHALYNSTKGYWERTISHNPDYVVVQGIGLAVEQPLLWLKPTPEMRRLVLSDDTRVRQFLNVLPRQMVSAIRANELLPLEPLNTTYIPRLNVSSDIRGTSIYTRVYRVNMYEDFVMNASLAVSQRNAAPLRLFKIGDPEAGGWLPTEDDLDDFADMLSMAETDPIAAILTHPHVAVDYVGTSDKSMLISREWDYIERVKLLAMGVAKSFIVGETSFASAAAGWQALLERVLALRIKLESDWIINKLCKPVAEIHKFYQRSQSELEHRIRIQKPEQANLVVPKIKWYKSLDPTQDTTLLNIWDGLHEKGLLSDRTLASGSGIDLEVERRNKIEEAEYRKQIARKLEEEGFIVDEKGNIVVQQEQEPSAEAGPELPGASLVHKKRSARYNPYDTPRRYAVQGNTKEQQLLRKLCVPPASSSLLTGVG